MFTFYLREGGKVDRLVSGNMTLTQFIDLYKRFCTWGRGATLEEYLKGTGYYITDEPIPKVLNLDDIKRAAIMEYKDRIRELAKQRPGFTDIMFEINGIKVDEVNVTEVANIGDTK